MKDREIIVLLDNVRSALNVGAIFRTCDGAGVKKLILSGITPYPPHKKLEKTALGSLGFLNWEHTKKTIEVIKRYKKEGFKIFSVEQTPNSNSYLDTKFPCRTLLIFGNEIMGVSSELLEVSDDIVELPMLGKKNSLNVATTVGIIVYHVRFSR